MILSYTIVCKPMRTLFLIGKIASRSPFVDLNPALNNPQGKVVRCRNEAKFPLESKLLMNVFSRRSSIGLSRGSSTSPALDV
jgi:hypothetical protein